MIEGLSTARLANLNEFLKTALIGQVISDPPIGGESPIWSATDKCRELCQIAHQTYTFHATPLFFIPVASTVPNAYAINLNGFDAIVLTDRLIKAIDGFTLYLTRYLELMLDKPAPVGQVRRFGAFSVLSPLPGSTRSKMNALYWIIRDGVLAFLVGHELGHLASGHIPVLIHHRDLVKNSAGAAWDEAGAADAMDAGTKDARASEVLVAHEIDADIQGMHFLARHWCNVVADVAVSTEQQMVSSAVLATTPLRYMMSIICIGIAFMLLGLEPFNANWKQRKSHPSGATRILTAMISMSNFFPDADGRALMTCQAAEALTFVHAAWGQALLQHKPSAENPDHPTYTPRDAAVYAGLSTMSADARHAFLFNATGIDGMVQASGEMETFLQHMSQTYGTESSRRVQSRRTRPEQMVIW